MRPLIRLMLLAASLLLLAAVWPDSALAQRGRGAPPVHRPVDRGAVVFVGGYFYDPFFGPYPWWGPGGYPYPYYPVFQTRAVIRVMATPKDAGVYVDGFFAGTVHDFNDWFQGLPVTPGGHEITLFLEGYRTVRQAIYASPGATVKLRQDLERLPTGEVSEPPTLSPPVPPPPDGTYEPPRPRPNPS
jgi:hypothetical protein